MPKKSETKPKVQIFSLKITLLGTDPPIWRRVEVPSYFTLGDLHHIIQISMGWYHSHLWEFHVKNECFSDPSFYQGYEDEFVPLDASGTTVSSVFTRAGSKIQYTYDLGDSWLHEIVLEKKFSSETDKGYPVCVDGKLACPPEDCGGIYGFYDLLEILRNPDHEEHESMKEWVGEKFDPEKFDIKNINKIFKKMSTK